MLSCYVLQYLYIFFFFFFSSRRRHTRLQGDWSSDVCSSDLLAAHANIVGVKDSSGDAKNLAAYRDAAPQWSVFVGSGSLLYAALELGCDGGILAVACFAAALSAQVFEIGRAHV